MNQSLCYSCYNNTNLVSNENWGEKIVTYLQMCIKFCILCIFIFREHLSRSCKLIFRTAASSQSSRALRANPLSKLLPTTGLGSARSEFPGGNNLDNTGPTHHLSRRSLPVYLSLCEDQSYFNQYLKSV